MRALITGVTGQDGSYLAQRLTAAGYEVYGLVRGQANARREWLEALVPGIRTVEGDLLDSSSLHAAVYDIQPDHVYNLGAVSAPNLAWRQPVLTAEVTGLGLLRALEAVRTAGPPWAHVVQASSIATHGPYGAAKLFAHAIARDYRAQGMHVSTVVMGGHHSPRRGREFLSRKVSMAVARIATGDDKLLHLGGLSRSQDWGWAPDFVNAMSTVARSEPDDYVLSTGDPHSCEEWVAAAFAAADLDWLDHVELDEALSQPTDVPTLTADPDPRLGWAPTMDWRGVAAAMVRADLEALR